MSAYAASFRRAFSRWGRRVTLRRPGCLGPLAAEPIVRARIRSVGDVEVAGGIGSSLYRVLVLAEDVPAAFRPLRQGDEIVTDGQTLMFLARPDDQTKRDGEVLLAYDGEASGA